MRSKGRLGIDRNRRQVLGLPCDIISFQETLNIIDNFIKQQKPRLIVTLNAEMSIIAKNDPEFFEIISEADLIVPDGIGIVFAIRLLYGIKMERISGIDLMLKIMEESVEKKYKIFLLGAREEVNQRAKKNLQDRFKGLNIIGSHNGYFKEDERICEQIAVHKPDILFIGLGTPKQEKWINKYFEKINVPICMGVGGSFDVVAEDVKRAPYWMQKYGLEWLFRLIRQPWRIKREMVLPMFVLLVLKEWLKLMYSKTTHGTR